jgi:AraC-like DNA-binding protein
MADSGFEITALSGRFHRHPFPLHAHPEYVFGLVLSGARTTRVGGRTRVTAAGDIVVHNPFEEHKTYECDVGWSYIALYPSASVLERLVEGPLPALTGIDGPDREVAARLWQVHRSIVHKRDSLEVECGIAGLAARLLNRCAGLTARSHRLEGAVARVRALLDDDLTGALSLDGLSREAGVQPLALLRAFRKAVGCTPQAYRTARRLGRAKAALGRGKESLVEVALAAGYCDQSHFTRVFHQWIGMTPGQYRASVRAGLAA